jgi:hypothetical protein
MRRTCLVIVLAAMSIETSIATCSAQLWPGRHRNYGSYDGYDSDALWGAYALSSANSAARDTAQGFRAWSQQAGPPQTTTVQSNVRSAMADAADRRTQGLYDQQQANRDWWLQTQQRQVAQQQAVATEYELQRQRTAAASFEDDEPFTPSSEGVPEVVSRANMDVIKWAPLLRATPFAQQRARIEAPYRRSTQGLSTPTAKDYKDMSAAVAEMKLILQGMAGNVSAQAYMNTEAFLKKLDAEIQDRLAKATPKK